MLDQVVFSKCSLQFNRQNWKTPQSVVVMAVEDFTNDAGQKMNIGLEVIKTQTRGKRQLAFGGPINAMNAFPGFNVSSLFLVKISYFLFCYRSYQPLFFCWGTTPICLLSLSLYSTSSSTLWPSTKQTCGLYSHLSASFPSLILSC